MATKDAGNYEKSGRIISHREAKGIDICGGSDTYIIRSDLGCYMFINNYLDKEQTATIYPLHPTCANGDHYFSHMANEITIIFYIIKGKSCCRVTDLSTNAGAEVFDLHEDCQGGDFYLGDAVNFINYTDNPIISFLTTGLLTSFVKMMVGKRPFFVIVYAKDWTFKEVSCLDRASPNAEKKKLHENCQGGLYYWMTQGVFSPRWYYIVTGVNEWGVQIHYTQCLATDKEGYNRTIDPSITNFLPGGFGIDMGVPAGRWELLTYFSNGDGETPVEWTKEVSKTVGHKKMLSVSNKMNWDVTTKYSVESTAGLTVENIATAQCKSSFSCSTSVGGEIANISQEEWTEEKVEKEMLNFTVKPKKALYLWQYRLGYKKGDIFQDMMSTKLSKITDTPTIPTEVPGATK